MDSQTKSFLAGPEVPFEVNGTIHGIFQDHLAKNPGLADQVAVSHGNDSITFGGLDKRSCELAKLMADFVLENQLKGNPEGDHIIAVCLNPSIQEIVSILAILKSGCAYLPLDINFPPNRIVHILQDSKPLFLLTTRLYLENNIFSETILGKVKVILIEDLLAFEDSKQNGEGDCRIICSSDDPLAVVLYTSGSTGIPKGVRLLHKSILHRLTCQWTQFPFEENEVCCAKTVRTFVDSIPEIWGPILQGVPLVVVEKSHVQDPQKFVQILKEFRVTRLILVPSLLSVLFNFIENYHKDLTILQHVRIWICSGEVLSPKLVRWFFKIFPRNHVLCNFYGSTEVTCDVTTVAFSNQQEAADAILHDKVPLGKPLPCCQIYLLRPGDLQLVGPGETGEIYVAGKLLAAGYVNGVENERFVKIAIGDSVKQMFRTGDFGRIVNGSLFYDGRADSQVKVRGHRVDLEEISLVVQGLSCVKASSVLCYQSGSPEQEIVCFIQVENGTTSREVFNILRGKLMSYMVPQVVLVPKIPLLVNGKIDRQALLFHYKQLLEDQGYSKIADLDNEAVSELENPSLRPHALALVKTIRSVLGSSVRDRKLELWENFFEIGGTSLDSVALVLKIRDLGYSLELEDFLKAGSLEDIVTKMVEPSGGQQSTTIQEKYSIEVLQDHMKDTVDRIIGESFLEKLPIVKACGATYEDLVAVNTAHWGSWVRDGLSFVVRNASGTIVGVSLNNNGFCKSDEPLDLEAFYYVSDQSEFLDRTGLEMIRREYDNPKIFKSFKLATDISLGAAENVTLMLLMEEENLRLAKTGDFDVIFSVNGNKLTQQITADLLGYEVMMEMPSNIYVASDGTKPFAALPDWDMVTANIKRLKKPRKLQK